MRGKGQKNGQKKGENNGKGKDKEKDKDSAHVNIKRSEGGRKIKHAPSLTPSLPPIFFFLLRKEEKSIRICDI